MAVTDVAILKIQEMIRSGELSPGDRLPPEKELSDRLGLSRNSMREAVKALEVIRVLDVRQGDGTYVTSLSPVLLLESIAFVLDLHHDQTVLELFAVRRILEPAATGIAASRIDAETLERLHKQLDLINIESPIEQIIDSDLEFHRTIVAAAGNESLSALSTAISTNTVRARLWRGVTQNNATARTLEEHRGILNALVAGDSRLAEALALAHIAGVEEWLTVWIESDQGASE